MAGNTTQTMMTRRGYSPGRVIVGLLLGLVAGWIVCEWVADVVEIQPVYRLHGASNDPFSASCVGPCLLIHEKDTQFRRIADGELVKRLERVINQETSFFHCIDHPELGPDTLIGTRYIGKAWAKILFQPVTGEERVLYQWNRDDKSVQLSQSGKYFTVTRMLPMTPLLALGINGLPGAVNMSFYHHLGYEEFKYPAFKMTLVQVYSSLDGQLLGTCSLPCQLGIHVKTTLLDDGKHLLLSCTTFSKKLGEYFLARSAAPEDQEKLATLMLPLTIMDSRSGQIIKQWPDLGTCSLDQIDERNFFHVTNDFEPVRRWAQSNPGNLHYRILNTQSQLLIELKRPAGGYIEAVNHHSHGYLVHGFKYVHGDRQLTTIIFMTSHDNAGAIISEKTLYLQGGGQAQLIPGQRQVIISQDISKPWQRIWANWTQRWPWLKNIHTGYSSRRWVWDIDSGETHLVTTSPMNTYEATPDGKHLLLAKADSDGLTRELSVYALPLPPLNWWAIWLPRLAGCALALLIWSLVLWKRSPKQSRLINS